MKALKKDPIHKKIMATWDDYGDSDMFTPNAAIAAFVDKRMFLLKRLLGDPGRFTEQYESKHYRTCKCLSKQ